MIPYNDTTYNFQSVYYSRYQTLVVSNASFSIGT